MLSGLWCSYIIPPDATQRKCVVLSNRLCQTDTFLLGGQLSCKVLFFHRILSHCQRQQGTCVKRHPWGDTVNCHIATGERTRKPRFLLILLRNLRRRDCNFSFGHYIVWLTVCYSLTCCAWYLQAPTMSKRSLSIANDRGTWSRSGAITRSLPRF